MGRALRKDHYNYNAQLDVREPQEEQAMKTAIILLVLLVGSPNFASAIERPENLAALPETQDTAKMLVTMWRSGRPTGQLATIMFSPAIWRAIRMGCSAR